MFQGSAGAKTVTLKMGNIQVISPIAFTYDATLTATITGVSPQTTTVFGKVSL